MSFHTLALAGEYRALLLAAADRYPGLPDGPRGSPICVASRANISVHFCPTARCPMKPAWPLDEFDAISNDSTKASSNRSKDSSAAHRGDGTLQEDFVTIREDRFVVPIVAGSKEAALTASFTDRVEAAVRSYIEPLETIGLNNQLVRLREDELREIRANPVRNHGSICAQHADEILPTFETLVGLDLLFAKASFAHRYGAVIPRFSSDESADLSAEARHPLLQALFRKQRKAGRSSHLI